MKNKVFILLLALLAMSQSVRAYDFSYTYQGKTLYYSITNSSLHWVEVVNPSNSSYSGYVSGALAIPDSVENRGVRYAVTSIGNVAFRDCTRLDSVTIGNSVTSIGIDAFNGCTGLISVTIGNSVTSIGQSAFSGCTWLTSVMFNADSCTYVGVSDIDYCYNNNCIYRAFYGCSNINHFVFGNNVKVIPAHLCYGMDNLTSVTIPNSVIYIDNYAFSGCTGLTSVTIPNSVTTIGESAFSGCTGLTSVTIPNSVTSIGNSAFSGCTGLTSVTIPNSVTSIDHYAFALCTGLTSITIPNSVTNIGQRAFQSCTGLTSATIGNSVTSIGLEAFRSCTGLTSVTIGNSVTAIWGRAFYGCTGLTSITIPNSVTYIDDNAFNGCTGLTSVTIGSSLTSIGTSAFYGTGLTSVTIPNSVTNIGVGAFDNVGCVFYHGTATGSPWGAWCVNGIVDTDFIYADSSRTTLIRYIGSDSTVAIPNSVTSISNRAFYGTRLTFVTIPNSVTSIGNQAFSGTGLTYVTIPDSVTTIGGNAFSGVWCVFYHGRATGSPWGARCVNGIMDTDFIYMDSTRTTLVGYHGSSSVVTIPNSVTTIGNRVFYDYTGLTSVTIPNSVTTIGESAFWNCTGLTSVTIPNSVTSIGTRCFAGCTGLTSVTIPNSVTSIGTGCFAGCTGITSITSLAPVAPLLGDNAFYDVPSTVNIPCGSWGSYASRWRGINFIETFVFTYSATSSDETMGYVNMVTAAPTCHVPRVVFHAAANSGFQFSHWSDHNTDNPRFIMVTQDTSITAYFEPATPDTVIVHDTVTLLDTVIITQNYHDTLIINNYIYDTIYLHDTIFVGGEGIGDVKVIDAKIYTRDGQIVVEGAEGMPVVLYDAVGRQLTALREEAHGGTPLRFDVPASGVYIVKIGTLAAQKVVVIR